MLFGVVGVDDVGKMFIGCVFWSSGLPDEAIHNLL